MRSSRFLVLLLAVLPFSPSTVMAGRNAGGALIVHTNDAYSFSSSTACTTTCGLPASCEEAITRSDKSTGTVVWLLAAFPDTTSPSVAGIYFGIDYDDSLSIQAWKFCGPAGTTEVTDDDWPFEGRGNSLAFAEPVEGQHLFPFYVFKIDGGTDSCYFSTAVNPTGGNAAFVDGAFPPNTDGVTSFGTVRWYQDGENDCPPVGGGDDTAEWQGGDLDQDESQGDETGGSGDPPESLDDLTFIQLTTTTVDQFTATTADLRTTYGLRLQLGLRPDGLIGRLDSAQRAALCNDPRVALVTTQTVPGLPAVDAQDLHPGDPGFSARVWNSLLGEQSTENEPGGGFPPGYSCLDSEVTKSDSLRIGFPTRHTSDYMLGDIGATIIFMESTRSGPCDQEHGFPEDWNGEQNNAYAYITSSLQSLAAMAPDGRVFLDLSEVATCSTGVEPIQLNSYEQSWKYEALRQLSAQTDSLSDGEKEWGFCNRRRSQRGFDWWFIIYVIDDDCDGDKRFLDQNISVGSYMGPQETLLCHNGTGYWYLLNMIGPIAVHETCHVFGALDEYCCQTSGCTTGSGYLQVRNGNDTLCVASPEEWQLCRMRDPTMSSLCEFTRGQIGWRDTDGDHFYDPIDHPRSDISMLVGEGDSLRVGDWVDIFAPPGNPLDWVKRLPASLTSTDRGRLLWDGIKGNGNPAATGTYLWTRNGESVHTGSLQADTLGPGISGLWVGASLGGLAPDTVRFRFGDADSRCGRVRLVAEPQFSGAEPRMIIWDKFLVDSLISPSPIVRTFFPGSTGEWMLRVQVWDVGDNEVGVDSLIYRHVEVAGVNESRDAARGTALSHLGPNPTSGVIAWELELRDPMTVDLLVVSVDGRRVKSWLNQELRVGRTRFIWDGRNDGGARVASGRYYLLVRNKAGETMSRSVTIVR